MSDQYQAIYDAVRSKFNGGGNIEDAVRDAMREFGIGYQIERVAYAYQVAAVAQERPSVLYRPKIYIDGKQWRVLYGDNLQDGIAGYGDSPQKAMEDFDENFSKSLSQKELDK